MAAKLLLLLNILLAKTGVSIDVRNTMNPDIRKAKESDFKFAFVVKKEAMEPHISVKWGWDEDFQRNIHSQRWREKPWYIITLNQIDIGTLSLHELESGRLRFGEFYLLKAHQNKGIGTQILERVIKECDSKKQTIVLEYLKWNPVGELYKRHGFTVTSENDIHYFMERNPNF